MCYEYQTPKQVPKCKEPRIYPLEVQEIIFPEQTALPNPCDDIRSDEKRSNHFEYQNCM